MTPPNHQLLHLTGDRRVRGRKPVAVYRAITRQDDRPLTLADAIRDTVGFDAIAGAIHVAPLSLRKNIVYGRRGVRPRDAQLIARMVDQPLDRVFIDTRTL